MGHVWDLLWPRRGAPPWTVDGMISLMADDVGKEQAQSGDHEDRTARTAELVAQLHSIVVELEAMHPGRKFPLDGHLVGSIGEAAAEAMFDIVLVPASSAGHDAIAG